MQRGPTGQRTAGKRTPWQQKKRRERREARRDYETWRLLTENQPAGPTSGGKIGPKKAKRLGAKAQA